MFHQDIFIDQFIHVMTGNEMDEGMFVYNSMFELFAERVSYHPASHLAVYLHCEQVDAFLTQVAVDGRTLPIETVGG